MKKLIVFLCILQTGKMIAATAGGKTHIYHSPTYGQRDKTIHHSYGSSQLPITSGGAPFQSPPSFPGRPSQSVIKQNQPTGGFHNQPMSLGNQSTSFHTQAPNIQFQTISPQSSENGTVPSARTASISKDRRE